MGQRRLAAHKKKASRLNAHIVFIDESGLLMAPLLRRTWNPQGCTPVLYQQTRSYKKVSAIAALSVDPAREKVRLYFRLHPDDNINTAKVIDFLRHLKKQLDAPIIIIWDRLQAHRSRKVEKFINDTPGLYRYFLPPYAPELNPVENVWCYLKCNSMSNFTPYDLDDLTRTTHNHALSIQRKGKLLRSFIKHTPLFLCLR